MSLSRDGSLRWRLVVAGGAAALLTLTLTPPVAVASASTPLSFTSPVGLATPVGAGAAQYPRDVTTSDVNHDGQADVLVASSDDDAGATNSGLVSVYLANATGPPVHQADYPAGSRAHGIAAGDLNGDTYPDVVTTTFNGINILLGQSDGTLSAPYLIPASGGLMQPVIADLNGDGRLDVAAANDYHDSFIGAVTILLNNGNGTFLTTNVDLGQYTFPGRLAVGDLNGDAKPDLVATNGAFWVLMNNGDGTFATPVRYNWSYTNVFGQQNFPASLTGTAVADFNSDGKVDVAASQSNDSTYDVWFFPGNGDGTFDFAGAVGRGGGGGATSITAADVDNDGAPDAVTGSTVGAYRPSVFSIRNAPNAWPTVSYTGSGSSLSESAPYTTLAAVDLNGDRLAELITVDRLGRQVLIRKQGVNDTTPPTASISSPTAGATYQLNDSVLASYGCTDEVGGSGVASCVGTASPGTPVNTSTVGSHLFQVVATDVAGNTSTTTASYSVVSTTTGTVSPTTGGTVSTTTPVSSTTPVGTSVAVPPGTSGGTVSITDTGQVSTATPSGYNLLGQQIDITAPVATWNNPLALTFTLDSSVLPAGQTAATIDVFRDGVVVPDCPGGASATTAIAPDISNPDGTPCVQQRQTLGDGDAQFTVLTPHASQWNFGQPTDIIAPTISLTSPADNAEYLLGSRVTAAYTCSEEATNSSGLSTCVGTVPTGSAVNTSSVGSKTFTVTAVDNAGNRTSTTVTYRVIYAFSGFFSPVANPNVLNVVSAGKGVPLVFSLTGNQGLSILAGAPTSTAITCPASATQNTVGRVVAGDGSLSYAAKPDKYEYHWATAKAWAGTCRRMTLVLNDGTTHAALFKFK